jgi:putative ABC transport system permease protein
MNDLRFALRSLRKAPGFTAVAVLTLALGIGANTTIFSVINGILLKPPPGVADPARVVSIYTSDFSSGPYGSSSYPDFEAVRAETSVFSGVAIYDLRPLALAVGDEAEMITGQAVSGDFFSMLGTAPLAGRLLEPGDARVPGTEAVVVLSYGLWQRRFGGDAGIVGRDVRLNGHTFRVVGVAALGFHGLLQGVAVDAWVPATMIPILDAGSDDLTNLGSRGFFMAARLRPGVALSQARDRLAALARARFEQFPDYWRTVSGAGRQLTVLPESATRVPPQGRGIALSAAAILLVAVGLVLLIACANVANLLLARASRRRREIAVRISLGARRGQLVRHLMAESLLLAGAGAGVGLLLAQWLTGAVADFRLRTIPVRLRLDLGMDAHVLGFTALVAVVTAVAFGLVPALKASRPNLVAEIKGETAVERGRWLSLRSGLVVAQVAVSLMLLVGAGLFLRSLGEVAHVDPGFDPGNTVLLSFDLQSNGFTDERGRVFYEQLLQRAQALPGVEQATLAQAIPLGRCCSRRGIAIEGYTPRPGESTEINWNVVGTDYFRALRIPLVRGRAFTPQDRAGAPLAAIVNQAFARRYWPGQDPLGKRLGLRGPQGPFAEVVGVARDGKYRSLSEDPLPFLYVPFAQEYRSAMTLYVRAAADPRLLLPLLRNEVKQMAPGLPVIDPTTLQEAVSVALLPHRIGAAALGVLGGLAALLAVVGLYGVLAYSVTQRTREFGIRGALGADRRQLVARVVGEGMLLSAVGTGIGLVLALAVTQFVRGFLFGISALDPVAFAGMTLLVAGVTLVASWLPARRAARVAPMEALRYE